MIRRALFFLAGTLAAHTAFSEIEDEEPTDWHEWPVYEFKKQHHLDVADPKPEIRRAAANSFATLGADDRSMLLCDDVWPRVRCPEFADALLPLLRMPEQPEREHEGTFIDQVFLRLLELRPEAVRPLILEDLRRENPLLSLKVLLALPDRELPELDEVLAAHLHKGNGIWKIAPLIERYASGALLPEVVAFYKTAQGRWARALQIAFLRYWLKHDRSAGLAAIEDAARARWETRRFIGVLNETLADSMAADAEKVVGKFVTDEDPDIAWEADFFLLSHGSPEGKDVVIDRLVRLKAGEVEFKGTGMVVINGHGVRDFRACLLTCLNMDGESFQKGKVPAFRRCHLSVAQWQRVVGSFSDEEKGKYPNLVAAGTPVGPK